MPGPGQSVPRAELFAVCEVLRGAVPPLTIHTDHEAILTGMQQGREGTACASHPNADLWRIFWHRILDLGGIGEGSITIKWVPGHAEGDGQDAIGNRCADVLARGGAPMHELPEEDLGTASALHNTHIKILKWMGWQLPYTIVQGCRRAARPDRSGQRGRRMRRRHWRIAEEGRRRR